MAHLPNNTLLQGGKYKIVRFINSGGFGCTYEALHVMLDKRVAIKEFFVKDFCNRDEATAHVTVGTVSKKALVTKLRSKFIDEAKALCNLEHPGIVRVSDVFEENGTAYFVMKYIDGPSLSEMVNNEGPLSEERALRYILQAAEALQYVHENNRLHLDIKPANIMVDQHDHAVLIDFGASKQYDEEEGENTSTLLGKTPGYAPLEQLGNDVVRFMPATDIYALGATLYKMLTGVTPLSANLLAIGEDYEPLPDCISDRTKKAIAKAMEVNKKKRPQTVKEFIDLLVDRPAPQPSVAVHPHEKDKNVPKKKEVDTIVGVAVPSASQESSEEPPSVPFWKKIPVKIAAPVALVVLVGAWFIGKPAAVENKVSEVVTPQETTVVPSDTIKTASKQFTNSKGITFDYVGVVDSLGVPNGVGKGIYRDATYEGTYVGTYKDGLREGKATYETKSLKGKKEDENHFEGVYKDDAYAEGKLVFSDGSYYVGSFKNNSFETGKWYDKKNKLDGKMQNGKYI